MKTKLAASSKLKGALAWIMSEAFDLGYIPSINNTESTKLCLILSNKDSGKCALLGTCADSNGNEEVIAATVDVRKWIWAEDEGFTTDEIVDLGTVFKKVPAEALPWILQ